MPLSRKEGLQHLNFYGKLFTNANVFYLKNSFCQQRSKEMMARIVIVPKNRTVSKSSRYTYKYVSIPSCFQPPIHSLIGQCRGSNQCKPKQWPSRGPEGSPFSDVLTVPKICSNQVPAILFRHFVYTGNCLIGYFRGISVWICVGGGGGTSYSWNVETWAAMTPHIR